ncbi:MAG: hypothetical protein GY754_46465 [bacterium]|nr:hypothetical protein [bacterium]
MNIKNMAKQVIDSLPDNTTMDDIIHALYINTKFEHGEREIREGEGVSHEEVRSNTLVYFFRNSPLYDSGVEIE